MNTASQQGFTLIESLIIITIIAIMSTLALQALPVARSNQELISDTEQIRSLLLDAKERALNQTRPDDCLPMADMGSANRAPCSDVGIFFSGKQVIEFADKDHDWLYTTKTNDYVIATFTLNTTPVLSTPSLLFESNPPSVLMHKAGQGDGFEMKPYETATIQLNGYGALKRTLTVHPYGTIDLQ